MNTNKLTNEINYLADVLNSQIYTDLLGYGLDQESAYEGTFGGDFDIVADAHEDPFTVDEILV